MNHQRRLARLKTVLHDTLHRFGFDVVPYRGRYFPSKLRTETIHRVGVTYVIDVGANEGQFVAEIRRDGWRGPVLSIEPLPDTYARLSDRAARDRSWTAVNVAAGRETRSDEINVAKNRWSSSLLPMSDRHRTAAADSGYVGVETITVRTLDDIIASEDPSEQTYFVKVDTQGTELDVLEGAARTLEKTAALELELSLVELYVGQPLISEVMIWTLAKGFFPIALAPTFVSDGDVLQLNGLFVPRASSREMLRKT